ncbi:MAG: thioredoxin family protein [Dehalococcoidia bacterium]
MVQQKESVVTPERYAQGMTYEQYVGSIERNRARFQENYDGTTVQDDDVAALKGLMQKAGGPAKMLVLGEDWCPDVFRGMPVFARVAEATGMELRVFPRDQHKDIMAQFLKDGEFESIPVTVFYTKDMEYIAHFIERPVLANEQMHELAPMYLRMRKPDKTPEEAEAAKQEYIAFQNGPTWGGWRQETIKEVIRALEERVR